MVFRVPTRDVSQQGLGSAPIRANTVTASADAFGANIGQALQGVGSQLNQTANQFAAIAQEQQDKLDVSQAIESYNGFRDGWRKQDKAFKSRLGLDAEGVTKDATKFFDEAVVNFSKELSDGARTRFLSLAQGSRNSSLDGMSKFESSQNDAAFINQMGALSDTAINDAIEDFTDPNVAENSRSMINTTVRAQLRGQSEEVVDNAIKGKVSIMQEGIVNRIAETDINAANDYFEANKDEFTAGTIIKLEKSIGLKLTAARSEELLSTHYDEETPIDDVVSSIQKSSQPQNIKDEAVRRAKNRRSADDAGDRERSEDAFDAAYSAVLAGEGIDNLSSEVIQELSGEDMLKLTTLDDSVKNGHAQVSNSKSWQTISTMPPEELASVDILREFGNDLTQADIKNALTLQRSARAGLAGGGKDTKMIRATDYNEALQVVASSAGLINKNDTFGKLRLHDDVQAKRFQQFDQVFRREVDTWLANNKGKNLSRTEIQDIGNRLLTEQVYVDDATFFGDSRLPIVALTPDDVEDAYLEGGDIDPAVRNTVKGAFNTRKKLTNDDVADMLLDIRLNRPVDKVGISDIPPERLVRIEAAYNNQGVTFASDSEKNQAFLNLYLKGLLNALQ